MTRIAWPLVFVLVVAACATGTPIATTSPPIQSLAPAQATTPPDVPDIPPLIGLLHQAADLEGLLPAVVQGRALASWSVRGVTFFTFDTAEPAPSEIREFEATVAELAAVAGIEEEVPLDDVALAVAGRSDVDRDPPYLINAYRFGPIPADKLPLELAIEHPGAGSWNEQTVGGKSVLVGTTQMFDQTEHVQGLPYLYDWQNVRFIVATADIDWAADALRQLP